MEAWGSRVNRTNVYIHGTPGPMPHRNYEHQGDIYNEFHLYAMDWYPDHIDFFRDEEKILTYKKDRETILAGEFASRIAECRNDFAEALFTTTQTGDYV